MTLNYSLASAVTATAGLVIDYNAPACAANWGPGARYLCSYRPGSYRVPVSTARISKLALASNDGA